MSGTNLERLKYVAAVILYGTIGTFLRFVDLPSEVVALGRGVIGSLFLFFFLALKPRRDGGEDLPPVLRANAKWLLLSGVFLGLNWIFLFAAYTITTVAVASLCNYMAPVIVVLTAPIFLREKPDPRKLPCVLAALFGIALVSGVIGGSAAAPNPAGVTSGLIAALCFAGIVLCNRKIKGVPPLVKAAVQLAVSAVTILPYVLAKNGGTVPMPDLRSGLIVLLLGVVHTGFAYCLYFSGMGSLPVQTVAILGYLEPVVSVLCSAAFLREPLSPAGWAGAALILAAAFISEIIPDKSQKTGD